MKIILVDNQKNMFDDDSDEIFDRYFQVLIEKIDRPYSQVGKLSLFRYLKEEIHNWLVDHNTEYSIGKTYYSNGKMAKDWFAIKEWFIDIENDNIAMLFKLTWL
jgi:hypothetical protein